MIAIIDSGVANLTSVVAALDRLGQKPTVTRDPATLHNARRVILPGVGAAPAAMAKLRETGLCDVIQRLTQPVLGICLGMQLMFTSSQESAVEGQTVPCLGLIEGCVQKLPSGPDMQVPHMGWNKITFTTKELQLAHDIPDGAYMYFVHSFAAPLGESTLASCNAGVPFTALCGRDNFFGCQFHPERSGLAGQTLLRNFIEMRD